jgi:hypothetical protein
MRRWRDRVLQRSRHTDTRSCVITNEELRNWSYGMRAGALVTLPTDHGAVMKRMRCDAAYAPSSFA